MVETLITLVIVLVILGVVVYLLNLLLDAVPMDGTFKQIARVVIYAVMLIAVLVYLLRLLPTSLT